MNAIPLGWIKVLTSDVAQIVGGGTPPSKDEACFTPPGQGIPWITPADLSGYRDQTISRGTRDLSTKGLASCSAKVMPTGTVLFSSRAPIGYVAIASNPIATNQGFKSFVLPKEIDSRFAYYQLKHIKPVAEALATGTTFKELSGTAAAKLPFLVAPYLEQKRIADKLDTVLTRVDAVNTRLARVAPLLKRFRQSVLAAATSGRLTEDWRDIQQPTGAQTKGQLDTITQARLQRMKKAKDAVERTKSEEFDIPQSWLWTSLDALTAKIVDGTHHTPTYVGQGVPFVSVKDIRDGVIDFSNTKLIAEEEHRELSKRCFVERGDLLITKSGTIGRTAIVKTDTPFSLFVSVALLKPASSAVNMRFIDFVLQHWIGSIDVSSRIVGSTIKNLHLIDMKVLGIPFPRLDEQAEIVRRVETLFAFADRLEARLQTAQTAANRLTPALLAKAFRGELVPQDPNDEPASELLKRLAEQGLTSKTKRLVRKVKSK